MQRVTPCLWFDSEAEEAARFYTGIFKNSKIGAITRYTEAGREFHGKEPGAVMTIAFELDGQSYTALNGGPIFKFNEAVSLQVNCASQEEIDYYWAKLSEGGDPQAQQCGWLKDKFGLSWQILSTEMMQMLEDKDSAKTARVLAALFPMKKLDIKTLKAAFDG